MKKILLGSLFAISFLLTGSAHAEGNYDHKAHMTEMVAKIISLHEDGYTQEKIVEKLTFKKEEIKKEYTEKKEEYKEKYKEAKDSYMMSYEDCVAKGGKVYEKEPPVCEYEGIWTVKGQKVVNKLIKKSYRNGDFSDEVKMMQKRLNAFAEKKGYENRLIVDGKFGPATEIMVRVFQKYYKLTQDGIAGAKTFEKLDYYSS